jgi:hypothetical protein
MLPVHFSGGTSVAMAYSVYLCLPEVIPLAGELKSMLHASCPDVVLCCSSLLRLSVAANGFGIGLFWEFHDADL